MARIKQEATPNTAYASEEPEEGQIEHIPDLELEQRTLRKFDLYVLPQFMILVLIAYLDRSNIGNARVFGFEEGLNLTSHQFNDISTVFYATYVLFEVPWVMAVKRYGANTVLGAALVLWSTVTLCTGFVQTYTQCLVMRLLLGAAEAGLFPALSFVISTIWDRQNQVKRVSLLYMSSALSGAFGKLFAYGVQSMGRQRGLDAWRWLFIIEGAISLLICSLIWFTLPKSAEEA
ncbi:Putative major facilitator superfamily, MFS transporter superfamily [Septoria linicola]|uniref:Major facilitator superfamily, MFS transporter superfamily n=1 Tax=Septoria linicola TaxID=215465 RepID=A0A9Q9EFL4_9PEZI|nr:Putative major facilitator superfamily, MFS transporter superfamily [Septoria linicola]